MQAAARPRFELEDVSPEDLAAFAALEEAAQVAYVPPAPQPPAPQPLPFPPPPSAGNVTCELLSATHFAVRVPAGLRPYAQAALAGLPVRLVARTDTGDELVAALGDYAQVSEALDSARLFRTMPRGGAGCFDGGGRIPQATLKAMRAVAQQQPLDARQHAEQAELYARIPVALRDALLPFQREGVRIGLQRDGRMLLADEVGVGKTLQALALAAAYAHEGPILIIVPASLRFMWAEQVEKWLRVPPHACTVVLGVGNMPELDDLPRRGDPQPAAAASPRVVITSYHMLQQVDHNVDWARFAWGCVVVDESHNMRAANRDESAATQIAVRVVKAALHAILMSGTPAMDRPYDLYCQVDALHPGLLNSKDVFANGYCERRPSRFKRGAFTCSGGARLQELHLLLRSTVMLRREKKEVAAELPPMRRQVVRLDVADSHSVAGFADMEKAHMVGWRKVEAACEWLADALLRKGNTPKSVIFVYHMDIMVRLKAFLETHIGSSKDGMVVLETPYVTINGDDDSRARQDAVVRFRSPHVRVALLSIAAASTGLDFSSAEAVVFVELPQSASDLEQAEARVHRRGVCGDVNVYYLVGRGTGDESDWSTLDAAIQRCHEVHGAVDSGGLRVDSVVDAQAGAVQLLPSHAAAPAASEALPSQPSASPPAPEGDVVDVPAHALCFEMSVHTGLLHAFLQDGDDFQHLGFARLPFASRNADFPFSLPAVRSAAVAFWAVWESLKIVDHQALRRTAKPMRLPLDDTLRAAHAAWKSAPSTFRIAKRGDVIAAPLAGWKSKKYVFLKQAGSDRLRYELYIGANDEWLCWACSKERARVQHPHGGSDPTVTALLELCCSVVCHDSLRAKTSRGWARKQVFKEERGVCQKCGLDCEDLKSRLLLGSKGAQLPLEDRRRILLQVEPRYKEHEALMMKALTTGVLWEADHLIPVAEGGGQCGRENLRTLCLMCHVDASGAQAGRGAKKRRAAKASRAVAVDQPLDDATLAALGRCAADDEDEFEEDKPPKSKSTKPKKAKAKAGK